MGSRSEPLVAFLELGRQALFIPLRDDNSLKSIPFQYVTVGLIAVNVLVYLLEVGGLSNAAVASFGGHAARAVRGCDSASTRIRSAMKVCRSTSSHAPHLHVLSCRRVPSHRQHAVPVGVRRQRRGRHGARPVSHFLSCCAGFSPACSTPGSCPASDMPLIGASGAVAGVIAAYLMLHPRVNVWVLAFKIIPLRITAGSGPGDLGRHPDHYGGHAGPRPGGLVGAYRRPHRRGRAHRFYAPPWRAAVRPGRAPYLSAGNAVFARCGSRFAPRTVNRRPIDLHSSRP